MEVWGSKTEVPKESKLMDISAFFGEKLDQFIDKPIDAEVLENVTNAFVSSIKDLPINNSNVKCQRAVGFRKYFDKGRIKVKYILEDGSERTATRLVVIDEDNYYEVDCVFRSRRYAGHYARRNYKSIIFTDLTFTPVTPLEYIKVDVIVENPNGQEISHPIVT